MRAGCPVTATYLAIPSARLVLRVDIGNLLAPLVHVGRLVLAGDAIAEHFCTANRRSQIGNFESQILSLQFVWRRTVSPHPMPFSHLRADRNASRRNRAHTL